MKLNKQSFVEPNAITIVANAIFHFLDGHEMNKLTFYGAQALSRERVRKSRGALRLRSLHVRA